MRKMILSFIVGTLVGVAAPSVADVAGMMIAGNLSALQDEVHKSSVLIQTMWQDVRGSRQEVRELIAATKKLTDRLEEEQAWRRIKEAGK